LVKLTGVINLFLFEIFPGEGIKREQGRENPALKLFKKKLF
jgi:hypothetical protein